MACLSECKNIYSVLFLAVDKVVGDVWYFVCLSVSNGISSVPSLAADGRCVWRFICLSVFNESNGQMK